MAVNISSGDPNIPTASHTSREAAILLLKLWVPCCGFRLEQISQERAHRNCQKRAFLVPSTPHQKNKPQDTSPICPLAWAGPAAAAPGKERGGEGLQYGQAVALVKKKRRPESEMKAWKQHPPTIPAQVKETEGRCAHSGSRPAKRSAGDATDKAKANVSTAKTVLRPAPKPPTSRSRLKLNAT